MAKDRITELYERGRIFPDGKNSEQHTRPTSTPKRGFDGLGKHVEVHRPQHLENQRDTSDRYPGDASGRYHNQVDIKSWLRNGDATSRPNFDQSNAYRQKDGCVKRAAPPTASDRRDSGLVGGRLTGSPPKAR